MLLGIGHHDGSVLFVFFALAKAWREWLRYEFLRPSGVVVPMSKYNLNVVQVDLVGVFEVVATRTTGSAVTTDLVFYVFFLQLAVLVWIAKFDTSYFDFTLLKVIVGHIELDVLAGSGCGRLRSEYEGERYSKC